MEMPGTTVAAISAERKIHDITQNPGLRAGAFALAAAGGFLFVRLVHVFLTWLPTLGNGAQDKAGPIVTILKLLRTGLGN